MLRKIIKIDADKCNGCGACASACHEGAIEMINGIATLTREDYCDGLGDCLPACPTGAITFEEREAPAYNEEAVLKAKMQKSSMHTGSQTAANANPQAANANSQTTEIHAGSGCPGSRLRTFQRTPDSSAAASADVSSELMQWPVQIKLVPVSAPYFDGANLLIAADCTAYAYGNFHKRFMQNHITIIGCPKLDEGDYTEKLSQIISNNNIKSLTIIRMEVPCCGGIENAAKRALQTSGKFIPWQVITISTDGKILD